MGNPKRQDGQLHPGEAGGPALMAHAIIEEIGHILPPSGNLAETLGRAADYASHQGHAEVTLEHLLLALTEDPDASLVMSISRVEIDQLKGDVSTHLGRLEAGAGALAISADVRHVLEAAAAAARGRRGEIDGAIVLAAIVGDGRSTAAHMLRAHGLTFEDAIRALQQAAQAREAAGNAERPRPAEPKPAPAPVPSAPAAAERGHEPEGYRNPTSAEDILASARQRVQGRIAPGLPAGQPAGQSQGKLMPANGGVEAADQHATAMPGHDGGGERPAHLPTHSGAGSQSNAPKHGSAADLQRAEAAADAEFDRIATEIASREQAAAAAVADQLHDRARPHGAAPSHPTGEPHEAAVASVPQGPQPAPPAKRPLPPGAIRPNANPPPQQSPAARPSASGAGGPAPDPHRGGVPPQPAGAARPAADAFGMQPPPSPYGLPHAPAGTLPGLPPRREGGDPFGTPLAPAPHAANAARPPQPPPPPLPAGVTPRTGPGVPPPPFGVPPPGGMRAPSAAPPHVQAPPPPAAPQRRAETTPGAARVRAAEVSLGQMVENIPRAMRVGIAVVVEARIARADVKALAEGLQGGGGVWRHELTVTKAMSVRLRSPDGGFFIETSSPETQWIENTLGLITDDYASWRWTVTPRERGARRLQLVISARTVGTDGLTAETALPDQVVDVKVRVNYVQTAKRAGGWALAAIVGGVLARFGEDLPGAIAKLVGVLIK